MTRTAAEEKIIESRLERAARHVTDYWIPVNPLLMDRVKARMSDGTYDTGIEHLITDIRSDLSLFTFCILKIVKMMQEAEEDLPESFVPFDLLRNSGVEKLKEILALPDLQRNTHSLTEGGQFQLSRIEEAFVSASTAEALATSEALDAEGCYASALLRQVGIALVAWNYPAVYQEAVQGLGEGGTLDQRLAVELGFSPAMLAIRVFLKNGLPARYCSELGLYQEFHDQDWEYLSAVSETTIRLCRIGEALARARNKEMYPEARDDWELAKLEIERRLGVDGMKIIHERLDENMNAYVELVPDIFKPALILDIPDEFDKSDVVGDYYNPYLSCCSKVEREALKLFYQQLTADVETGSNVRLFVDKVFPATRFTGGCIFTIDPALHQLTPQMQLGELVMRRFLPVEYSLAEASNDLVSVAFRTTEPVIAYGVNDDGELTSMIAGLFGCSQRYGVFYLESPGVISDEPQQKYHFKALQHALNDSLNL
jgi:hypothetical protein